MARFVDLMTFATDPVVEDGVGAIVPHESTLDLDAPRAEHPSRV
ncbi:hypothetical protein [Amycolatopsis sp. H20-H5]|nr:hypothetical protein [Amycolatopsis sp. H20-H5]MEC3981897.1 hypothetical protein [Amycolatopsis sp. H20-H5]